eukprot:198498-Rhodomonas_salina.2
MPYAVLTERVALLPGCGCHGRQHGTHLQTPLPGPVLLLGKPLRPSRRTALQQAELTRAPFFLLFSFQCSGRDDSAANVAVGSIPQVRRAGEQAHRRAAEADEADPRRADRTRQRGHQEESQGLRRGLGTVLSGSDGRGGVVMCELPVVMMITVLSCAKSQC